MMWIWWAPLGASALHIFEEFVYPGGFADWDRAYRPAFRASITPRFHIVMNGLLLLLCAQVWQLGSLDGARARSFAGGAWIALAALLASNAVFHVVGTVRTRRRSPGVITGVLLYIPLACYGFWWFLSSHRVSPVAAGGAALLGGSYHAWANLLHRARVSGRTGATPPLTHNQNEDTGHD